MSGANNKAIPRTLWLVADQTSASIDIAAKPDEVMAVIAIDSPLQGPKKRVEG